MIRQPFEIAIQRALEEDLASTDLTSEATVDPKLSASASAIAKSELVVCGEQVFFAVFRQLDPDCKTAVQALEGEQAGAGRVLWTVEGNARALLAAERTALNFAQRMSGIATTTRRFVEALPAGSRTRITDTRKTTPGLRRLERHAVRVGGGYNHRDNLGAAVLIKDNHIVAAGGLSTAIERARNYAPHTCRIEVEVTDVAMLQQALDSGADVVMLDNFAPEMVGHAVALCRGKALVEVSGGVQLERVASLAQAGVDIISVGALTHSAPAADISLGITLS